MSDRDAPAPPAAFEAPWHGQVFALAVSLSEAGYFTWPEWTALFSDSLADLRVDHALDGADDYYIAWVSALERMMRQKDIIQPAMLREMKALWTEAFMRTPHGKPVIPDLPAGL